MMRIVLLIAALVLAGLGVGAPPLMAQDADATAAEEAESSRFVRFVEERISSPTMQIRLIGLRGTLSRNVRFDRITVSDDDGVWLSIEEPRLVWQRAALLRGRLQITELAAQSLTFSRPPLADESLPTPEARSFAIPELPVAVNIAALDLPRATFGEPVFGLASVLSMTGRLALEDGDLSTELDIQRLDGPGGALAFALDVDDQAIAVDARLREPADGVVANLLNIGDRPPVALTISGGGERDALSIDLGFDVDGARILDGGLQTRRGLLAGGTSLAFDLQGALADILPPLYRPFFGDRSELAGQVLLRDDGGRVIERFTVDGGALQARASGQLLPDGFPQSLDVQAQIATPSGAPLAVPGADATSIAGASLSLDFGGTGWTLDAAIDDLRAPDSRIGRLAITGGGALRDLIDPETRAVTYDIAVRASGLQSTDAASDRAIGDRLTLDLDGAWRTGSPLRVDALDLRTASGTVTGSGRIEGAAFSGDMRFESTDVSPLSGVAGRDLTGAARLALAGTVRPIGGAFDFDIDGALTGFAAGDDVIARLLAGDLALTGGVARTTQGLFFDRFEGENDQAAFAVNGFLASDAADLQAAMSLADLVVVDPNASGSIGAQFAITRAAPAEDADPDLPPDPFAITASVMMPTGRLSGQPVADLDIGFAGTAVDDELAGTLEGSGDLAGEAFALNARLARRGGAFDLADLVLAAGDARLAGDLRVAETGLATGQLDLNADDIGALAALALMDATGRVDARIALSDDGGRQDVAVDAEASGLAVEGTRIDSADIRADIIDVFGRPDGFAALDAQGVSVGTTVVRSLRARVAPAGADGAFDVSAQADIEGGYAVDAGGTLTVAEALRTLRLAALAVDTPYGDARLVAPATIIQRDGETVIDTLSLAVEGGRITASGRVGETIDVNAQISALPAGLANAVQPGLGAQGTISGTVRATGAAADPRVAFDLNGQGLSVAALGEAGVTPVAARASGTFAGEALVLTALRATNAQGLDVSASGRVPLGAGGLSITASGTAPLSLATASPTLAARGIRASGTMRFQATVTGATANPAIAGLVSISGGTITDPVSNIRLEAVNVIAGLEGDRLAIRNASADLALGGRVSASGTVGLGPGQPIDVQVQLSDARYTDGSVVSTTANGTLSLTGAGDGGLLLAGEVFLARIDITVPETLGSGGDLLEVDHVGAGAGTLRTLQRLAASLPRASGGAPNRPLRLDVAISAPNQVFVRGRGLDAELGGRLRVIGPVTAPVTSGAFNLIRGRLVVLNQRFDFTSGTVTLTGDLGALIDLTATTRADDLTAIITLRGPANAPDLVLSSDPELPEDEILARILFGADISSLSPLQIARLATAAATLAGGSSDVGGGLRRAFGVDDLDLVERDDGGLGVRAGRYISDNIYLQLETQPGGVETTINLDITDDFTARGSLDAQGDTSIGVFFERDY